MKRLLYALVCTLAIIAVSCKENTKKIENNATTTVQKDEQDLKRISNDDYQNWLKSHAIVKECKDDLYKLSEGRHRISKDSFYLYAREHSRNPTNQQVDQNWKCQKIDDIIDFMKGKKIECYNGWLGIELNTTDKIVFSREEVFDNFKTMYPETLFKGIMNKMNAAGATNIRICFVQCMTPVIRGADSYKKEKIAFKITYDIGTVPNELYYDMSDDPL